MNELTLAGRAAEWRRLKALVLDSVSSPITRRVYNPARFSPLPTGERARHRAPDGAPAAP